MVTPHILSQIRFEHPYFGSTSPQDILQASQLPQGVFSQVRKEQMLFYARLDTDVPYPLLIPMIPKGPYFINYSLMPDSYVHTSKDPYVWVLDSRSADKQGNIQAHSCQFVPLYPQLFQYPLPQGKVLQKVDLIPSSGPKRNMPVSTEKLKSYFLFNLNNYPADLYEAQFSFADGTTLAHTFVAATHLTQSPPFSLWLQQAPALDLTGLFTPTDLQIFEGIGEEEVLKLAIHQIKTWNDIASSTPELMTAFLLAKFNDEIVRSLPEQARLAEEGKWEDLVHRQRELYAQAYPVGEGEIPAKVLLKARTAKKDQANASQNNIPATTIPSFTIQFEARATLWRYVFVGLLKAEWEKSEIKFSGAGLPNNPSFTHDQKSYMLPNGQIGFSMTSKEPIPLRQKPTYKAQLESPVLMSPMQLPFAQATLLKRKKEDQPDEKAKVQYVSEIFVHL